MVIKTQRDFNKIIQLAVLTVLTMGIGFRFKRQFYFILSSAFLRGSMAVCFTTAMVSGAMWNRIRKPLPFAVSRQGVPEYISPSLQQQYGFEQSIVFGVYIWAVVSLVIVPLLAPTISGTQSGKNNNNASMAKRAFVIMSMLSFIVAYSVCLKLFRQKLPGYPFKLLL